MTDKKPKIVALFSGKGGAGKTTVTIALTKLLNDMGFRCLLVDFDLATNGSSYFFKNNLIKAEKKKGIWELLTETAGDWQSIAAQYLDLPIAIDEKLYFVASRLNLNKKGLAYEDLPQKQDALRKGIIDPLIDWATKKQIHYIVVDCQAGYSLSTITAYEIADLLIIVTEPDSISNKAADNLLFQLGFNSQASGYSFSNRDYHYLINKLDIGEAEMYGSIENITDEIFRLLNKLPPLPFNNSVRKAFGSSTIPIDIKKPSPFLFALVKSMRYIFKEIEEVIDEYEVQNLTPLYQEYIQILENKQKEKQEFEQRKAKLKTKKVDFQNKFINNILIFMSTSLILGILSKVFILLNIKISNIVYFLDVAFWFSLVIVLVLFGQYIIQYIQMLKNSINDYEEEKKLSEKIREISRDYDAFSSLMLSRSEKFSFKPSINTTQKDV